MAGEYTLSFIIEAENRAKATIDSVKTQLEGVEGKLKSMQPAFRKMALVGTAAFTAISAAITKSVKDYSDIGSEIYDLSVKTGFAAESLSKLRYMAEQSGSSIQGLEVGVKKMSKVLTDAKNGVEMGTQSLKAIGLTYDDLKGKKPEEQFMVLASAISSIEDPMERLSLAQDIFGKSGSDLIPMFDLGAEGMASLAEEATRLGIVFTQEGAAKAEAFGDKMNTLKQGFLGVKMALAEAFLPVLTKLLETIQPLIERVGNWIKLHPELASKIGMAALAITGIIAVVGTLGMILPGLIAGITALAGVIAFLTGPIGLVIAVIGIWVAVGKYAVQNWEEIKEGFIFIWQEIKDWFFNIINAISDKIVGWVNSAKNTIVSGWSSIKDFFKNLWEGIVGIFASAWERITGWANKIADIAKGVWDKAKNVASAVGEKVSGAWETVKGWFGSGGTIPRTGTYMLHKGEQVVSASGSGGIVVNINGGTYLDENVAEEIGDMIINKLKAIQRI